MAQPVARKLVWSEDSYPVAKMPSTPAGVQAKANRTAPKTVQSRRDTVEFTAGKTAPLFTGRAAALLDENMLVTAFVPKLDFPELAAMAQVNKAWYGLLQPKLRHLDIGNGRDLSKAASDPAGANSIDLSGHKHIGDAEIAFVTKHFPKLEKLAISEPRKLNDENIRSIAELKHLRSLKLRNCLDITSEGVRALKNLPLTRLDLSGCSNITASGLYNLKNLSKTLTELKLSGCDGMVAEGLSPLEDLRELEKLDLTWSEIPDRTDIAQLIEASPKKLQIDED